jgi:hypothetical protein
MEIRALALAFCEARGKLLAMGRPKKGPGPPRAPLKTWALRLTDESRAFLDEASKRENLPRATLAQRCIDDLRAVRTELGDDWFELERQAKVEGIIPGTLLGRMAKAALEKGRKR